jgi:TonB-linked SusC/RagA family outer membrane protein
MKISPVRSSLFAVVFSALLIPAAVRAQTGTVGGTVTDQVTNQPVVAARVAVVGTALYAHTNAQGRYVLPNVRVGQVTLKVSGIGYGATTRVVTITAGGIAAEDFALTLQPYSLDEVVVTATGEQEKRTQSNQIASIRADSLAMQAPVNDLNDLLTSRAPGVSVFESPLTGAEARVRIRGANSISLSNEPIYYIDGIRMQSSIGSSSIGIGGTGISRVTDINPDEIESIEIVKGPSASTLYGTDAANGVIVIKTKRGRAGAPRWNVYTEMGTINDYNAWPTAYRAWRTGPTANTTSLATNGVQCLLAQVATGVCTQDSVTAYNLWDDPVASPLGTGYRGQVGAQVSGGTDQMSYFVSTEHEREIGLLHVPEFAYSRFLSRWQVSEMPYEYYRPNAMERTSLRANVQTSFGSKFDVAVSSGFISSTARLPQTDNNTTGLMSSALGGPGHRDNWRFAPDTVLLFGYRAFTPEEMFAEVVDQEINRFVGSTTLKWHPNSWLTGRVIGGIDYTSRVDQALCKLSECTPFGLDTVGRKEDNRTGFHDYTIDANVAATYPVSSVLRGKTTFGVQYFHSLFERNGAFGQFLPPGATTVDAGAVLDADEATTETKTLGAFVEQQLAFRDRLFITAALRGDDNSAFGQDYRAVYYPKLGVSYVVSEESFFPTVSWLSNLRLRSAFGASGQQPGSTDALAFFAPTTSTMDGEDKAALISSSAGNAILRPERATELEMGFDAAFLESRVNLEFTYYRKRTRGALIARTVPPSVGGPATRIENLGSVRNSGLEIQVSALPINRPNLAWDVTFNVSHNTNKIEDMGGPPIVGTTIQQRNGYPIDGYWQRPILGFNDLNGDGIIAPSEVLVGDTAVFVGPSLAPTEAVLSTGLDLLNRKVRVSVLFDYKGGRWQLNGTERIRCESRLNCDGEIDPNAPLWKQARVVALRDHPARTQWGYFEPADAVRWRELSVTYELPRSWARLLRASRVSVTGAGRNLMRWTKYSGIDPESGYNSAGLQTDFQTQPPPTYWIFKLNASF